MVARSPPKTEALGSSPSSVVVIFCVGNMMGPYNLVSVGSEGWVGNYP